MANDSNAPVRETPHATRTSTTNAIMNVLKERALAVLNDRTIDPQSRAIIRYALETNDPWLAELVRRVRRRSRRRFGGLLECGELNLNDMIQAQVWQ